MLGVFAKPFFGRFIFLVETEHSNIRPCLKFRRTSSCPYQLPDHAVFRDSDIYLLASTLAT